MGEEAELVGSNVAVTQSLYVLSHSNSKLLFVAVVVVERGRHIGLFNGLDLMSGDNKDISV